jgi:hypothetical protein
VSPFRERKAASGVESAGKIDKGTIQGKERVQHGAETDETFKVRVKQKAFE